MQSNTKQNILNEAPESLTGDPNLGKRSKQGMAIDMSVTLATAMKNISELGLVPGLKAGAGSLLLVLNMVQTMKDVKGNLDLLAQEMAMTMVTVWAFARQRDNRLDTMLVGAIKRFEEEVLSLYEFVNSLRKRKRLGRFFFGASDKAHADDLRRRWDAVNRTFDKCLHMNTNSKAYDIHDTVLNMALGLNNSNGQNGSYQHSKPSRKKTRKDTQYDYQYSDDPNGYPQYGNQGYPEYHDQNGYYPPYDDQNGYYQDQGYYDPGYAYPPEHAPYSPPHYDPYYHPPPPPPAVNLTGFDGSIKNVNFGTNFGQMYQY